MDDMPNTLPPSWMSDALDRSEAQIAAGDIVPLDPVIDRLRASIERICTDSPDVAAKRQV